MIQVLHIDDLDTEDVDFDADKAQEIFDDFMVALPIDSRKMLAVLLMENFQKRQNMSIMNSAREAASIIGFNERTVRKYRTEFFDGKGKLKESRQGKYERATVYHDEEVTIH